MKFTASVGETLVILFGLMALGIIGYTVYDTISSVIALGEW
jgi:hypothetical protein